MKDFGPKGMPEVMPTQVDLRDIAREAEEDRPARTAPRRRIKPVTFILGAFGLSILATTAFSFSRATPKDESSPIVLNVAPNGYIDPETSKNICAPLALIGAVVEPPGHENDSMRRIPAVDSGSEIRRKLTSDEASDDAMHNFAATVAKVFAADSLDAELPEGTPRFVGEQRALTLRKYVDACYDYAIMEAFENVGDSEARVAGYQHDRKQMYEWITEYIAKHPRVKVRNKNDMMQVMKAYFSALRKGYAESRLSSGDVAVLEEAFFSSDTISRMDLPK